MIQLNLSEEQALAIYALIGFTTVESLSAYVSQVQRMIEDQVPASVRDGVWNDTAGQESCLDTSEWDDIIDHIVLGRRRGDEFEDEYL